MPDTKPPKRNQEFDAIAVVTFVAFVVAAAALLSLALFGSPSPQAKADTQASAYLNIVNVYNQGSSPGAFTETALNKAASSYPGVTIDSYNAQRAILSVAQGGATYQVCVNLTPAHHSRFCKVTSP